MPDIILETRNLTREFKGFVAVNQVNLQVQRGHIHALIGDRKSTRLNSSHVKRSRMPSSA